MGLKIVEIFLMEINCGPKSDTSPKFSIRNWSPEEYFKELTILKRELKVTVRSCVSWTNTAPTSI